MVPSSGVFTWTISAELPPAEKRPRYMYECTSLCHVIELIIVDIGIKSLNCLKRCDFSVVEKHCCRLKNAGKHISET